MEPHRLYIQQTSYNGVSYTKGPTIDIYGTWGIVCSKSEFRYYGDPKDVSTRNWLDEHGEDVYIPQDVKLKKFDAEFIFLFNGTEKGVKYSLRQFHNFLLGMVYKYKTGRAESEVVSTGPRLVLYDDYVGRGWKDVRLKTFTVDTVAMDDGDSETVIEVKAVFEVYDPYTEVNKIISLDSKEVMLTW